MTQLFDDLYHSTFFKFKRKLQIKNFGFTKNVDMNGKGVELAFLVVVYTVNFNGRVNFFRF